MAPRYFLPIIALPFLGFLGLQGSKLLAGTSSVETEESATLDNSLGESRGEILSKTKAYVAYKNAIEKEPVLFENSDSLNAESLDPMSPESQRVLSSIYSEPVETKRKETASSANSNSSSAHATSNRDWIRQFNEMTIGRPLERVHSSNLAQDAGGGAPYSSSSSVGENSNPYLSPQNVSSTASGTSYNQRNYSSGLSHEGSSSYESSSYENSYPNPSSPPPLDPARMLKEQLLVMDSLEKSRDPEFQKQQQALSRLEANEKLKKKFLESREKVTRQKRSKAFSSIYRKEENPFFRAVLDEDRSGYLGSRFRIRLLEDLWIGEKKLPSGTLLYAHISGFSTERVGLTIVSVFSLGEVQSVELEIYDLDGQKGLYVPGSDYREMIKELGLTSMNGNPLAATETSFYSSLLSSAFRSASSSAARMIRTNKARLKYGTLLYLKDAS